MKFSFLLLSAAPLAILSSQNSFALSNLKQVQLHGDREIRLTFDKHVEKNEIAIDYLNEIVQLSIQNSSVYPAKIMPLKGKLVKKVFAYQFSPKLIRCRFSLDEKVEKYRDHVRITSAGRNVVIKFDDVRTGKSEEVSAEKEKVNENTKVNLVTRESEKEDEVNEAELLNRVLQGTAPIVPAKDSDQKPGVIKSSSERVSSRVGHNQNASFLLPIVKVTAVSILLGLAFFFVRKKKVLDSITKIVEKGIGKDKSLINVVAKYYLDPKKSLILVRVGGRLLLLGSSQESIQVITELAEENVRATGSETKSNATEQMFADLITKEQEKGESTFAFKQDFREEVAQSADVRSRIRSRLEGFKSL